MRKEITGMMIYYFIVCKRKLWYFYHDIQMEQGSENVSIGKTLDEESYKRDNKHVNINDVINIDFIRSRGVIHEVKKSRKIEEASILQLKYYLYYLKKRGVEGIKGKIDYPLLKQSVDIELTEDDITNIENIIEEVENIVNKNRPESLVKKRICKACAYCDLCFV